MSVTEVSGVSYWRGGQELAVRRIDRADDIELDHAIGVLVLMADAYEHQYASPNGYAPPGTFRNYFDAEDSRAVERQMERMVKFVSEEGSQYWLFPIAGSVALGGLSKVTPSRSTFAQKAKLEAPHCYVNDVVVIPRMQRHGTGSMLMHAPLAYGGFEPDKGVALDANKGNGRVNSWFERLGMVPTGVQRAQEYGGFTLEQMQYATTPFVNIAEVRKRLESKHPWLTTNKAHHA